MFLRVSPLTYLSEMLCWIGHPPIIFLHDCLITHIITSRRPTYLWCCRARYHTFCLYAASLLSASILFCFVRTLTPYLSSLFVLSAIVLPLTHECRSHLYARITLITTNLLHILEYIMSQYHGFQTLMMPTCIISLLSI